MLAVNAPSLICRFNLAAPVYSVECFSHVDLIYVLRVRPITAAIESSYWIKTDLTWCENDFYGKRIVRLGYA